MVYLGLHRTSERFHCARIALDVPRNASARMTRLISVLEDFPCALRTATRKSLILFDLDLIPLQRIELRAVGTDCEAYGKER